MKILAKYLSSVALVLAVIFACLVAGTRLQVSVCAENIIPAAQESERYEEALRQIESGALGNRLYSAVPQGDMDDYVFVVLDLSVRSFGLLPCEWITAGVTPLAGDIALIENSVPDVRSPGRSTAQIWILADAQTAQTGHGVWIEYYAFGVHTYADAKDLTS